MVRQAIIKADANGYRYAQFQAPFSYQDQNIIVATYTIQKIMNRFSPS
ncbi:hypothetical protein GPJ61_05790 [Brevibacillus formosus]|nr:hypothetical protein [Brevibacillus formosus]